MHANYGALQHAGEEMQCGVNVGASRVSAQAECGEKEHPFGAFRETARCLFAEPFEMHDQMRRQFPDGELLGGATKVFAPVQSICMCL